MWKNRSVAVVLPTYREKASLRGCIEGLDGTGVIDEIIVVNNNAEAGTDEEVARTRARIVHETRQGFGRACMAGLGQTGAYWRILMEPDGTFVAEDVLKLLAYAEDFPVVLGTRTTRVMIWEGANMGFAMKWGNWLVAKVVEFMFNTTTLTDIGCTLRLVRSDIYDSMAGSLRCFLSEFNVEFLLQVIRRKIPFIEVPVNYRRRVGVSSVTGNKMTAFLLGCRMAWLALGFRFGWR